MLFLVSVLSLVSMVPHYVEQQDVLQMMRWILIGNVGTDVIMPINHVMEHVLRDLKNVEDINAKKRRRWDVTSLAEESATTKAAGL